MLQKSINLDGKPIWRDGVCDDEDDFHVLLHAGWSLEEVQCGEPALLLPVGDSIVWEEPSDMDLRNSDGSVRTPLLGDVAFAGMGWGGAGPDGGARVEVPKMKVNVQRRGRKIELHLDLSCPRVGVGKVMERASSTQAGQFSVSRKHGQTDGCFREYRIVPLRLLDRRVLKYAVRLREQSLRAAEAMHMVLSRQVRFDCKVCAERFAAFHPAYEPPQQISEALEVLRRGRSGVASCSVLGMKSRVLKEVMGLRRNTLGYVSLVSLTWISRLLRRRA